MFIDMYRSVVAFKVIKSAVPDMYFIATYYFFCTKKYVMKGIVSDETKV